MEISEELMTKMKIPTNTLNLNIMVNWNIISGSGESTSSGRIRKMILSFLTKHYPCSIVDSVEKKFNAYKISLMNGICLTFDADGRHIKTCF
ncbi:hypothetical protein [Chryseobacterium indologenes]|uniref:Uncharacterized protein n=1 Tax=Chryseobacterium indologenes TaxID=253 RepID=A0A0N1KSM9_CHRID|nr:hypothetical protein [Chryseobacterium indologenes]KPE51350.1 hypothetical protein AOB46_09380 [Chryseobacterium indologenes]